METPVYQVCFSPEFEEKFSSLPADIQAAAGKAIQKLLRQLDCTVMRSVLPPYWAFYALSNHSYRNHSEEKKILLPCLIGTHNKSKKETESSFEKPSHALSPLKS